MIVTAGLTEISRLINENYVCVSTVGKIYGDYNRKEEVEKIVGIGIFQHYYHLKANDYKACYILYRAKLEKLGFERIYGSLVAHLQKHKTTKLALIGNGKDEEFCYRFILADFLSENGIILHGVKTEQMQIQKNYWEFDIYKHRPHFNLTDDFVQITLESWIWVFASTMAHNPHHYTLRKDLGDDELYLKIASHIRFYGIINIYEGIVYRTLTLNGFQYWTAVQDIENTDVDLINRKKLISKD